MKRYLVVPLIAAVVTAVSGAAAASAGATDVICVSKDGTHLVYRHKPHVCTFHKRHEPLADAWEVHTKHDHWTKWTRRRARGHGKELLNMIGPVPVRIKLYKARKVCGHRVFTHARFTDPSTGNSTKLTLDNCV